MSGGMNMNMVRQAQKLQQEMQKLQQETEEREYTSASGGGAVKATVNGKHELLKLEIDDDMVIGAEEHEDVEILTDSIIAAVNDAFKSAADDASAAMSKLTGGLNLGF